MIYNFEIPSRSRRIDFENRDSWKFEFQLIDFSKIEFQDRYIRDLQGKFIIQKLNVMIRKKKKKKKHKKLDILGWGGKGHSLKYFANEKKR